MPWQTGWIIHSFIVISYSPRNDLEGNYLYSVSQMCSALSYLLFSLARKGKVGEAGRVKRAFLLSLGEVPQVQNPLDQSGDKFFWVFRIYSDLTLFRQG